MKTRILIIYSILLSLSQTTRAAHPRGQGRLDCQSRPSKEIKFSNTTFEQFKKNSKSTVVLDPNDFEKQEEKTHLEELQALLKTFHERVVLTHTKPTLPLVAQQAVILYLIADKQEAEGNKPLTECLQAKIAAIKGALPDNEQ